MAKQCITEKTIEKQYAIGCALKQMMMEQDYEDIFVSDLCVRAGISRRSFYRYFTGKDDVLRAILEDIIRDCHLNAVNVFFPKRELQEQLLNFFKYWKEKQSHWLEILSRNHQESLLIDLFVEWTQREFLQNPVMGDQERDAIAISLEFTATGLLMTLFRWGQTGYRKTPQEMAAHLSRIMTNPLYDNIWEKSAHL